MKCYICGRENKDENKNLGFLIERNTDKPICFDCDFKNILKRKANKIQAKEKLK